MLISELEAKLKELRELHGDLPVYNDVCIYQDDLGSYHPDLIDIKFGHDHRRSKKGIYIGKKI